MAKDKKRRSSFDSPFIKLKGDSPEERQQEAKDALKQAYVKGEEAAKQIEIKHHMDSINKGRSGIPDNAKPPKKKGK